MSLRRKFLLGLAAALAVAGGAYVLREPMRTYLIQPAFNAFFYLQQIYRALPQRMMWTLLILVGVGFGVHSMFLSRERPGRRPLPPPYYVSRVETWEKWLRNAGDGELYKLKLTTEMGDLLLRAVAGRAQISYGEARRWLQSGEISAPQQAVELINNAPLEADLSVWGRLVQRFRRGDHQNEIYRQMEALVSYLETELEVKRG